MPILIRLILALDLAAICVESVFPAAAHNWLPITGSHIGQLGIGLVVSIVLIELWEIFFKKDPK